MQKEEAMLTALVMPLAGLVAVAAPGPSGAAAGPPTLAPGTPAPAAAAPAPPFAPGMTVIDRTGAPVGTVESLAESTQGPRVVLEVDGKLVAVPQSTLRFGRAIVSSETKAQILRRIEPR